MSYIKALLKPSHIEATKTKYAYASVVLNEKCIAIADSGTTCLLLQIQSKCVDKQITNDGMKVKLPGGRMIGSTHTALLNIKQLPMKACRVHLFPYIKHALLLISMLCDQGYMAVFDKDKVYIIKDGIVLLHVNRDTRTNPYMLI